MLHPDIGLFGRSSDSWDTSCARKFLQIPEEELKKLESTPGWSTKKEINKKQENNFKTVEGLPTSQLKNPEKTSQLRTIHNTNISDALTQKSALPQRKKSKISSSTDQQLFHSIYLCNNNKVDSSAIPIPKNCSSVSDIYMLEEEERPPLRKSSLEDISYQMSTEQSTLSQPNKSSVGKSSLDTTYVIPSVLEDKTNDIQIVSDVPSQTSTSPVKVSTKKRTFENLETDSTNEPLLEEPVPKFGGLPVFPTNTISTQVSHESFLSKKLRLLEKRFSPSKNFSLSLSQENTMAKVNLKSNGGQNKLNKGVCKEVEGLNSLANIRLQVNAKASLEPEDGKAENMPSSNKAVIKERDVGSEAEKEFVEVASKKSNTNVFEEESFVSLPIPCGQPPPKDQPHLATQLPIKSQPSMKETLAEKADMPSSEKGSKQVETQECNIKGSKVGRKRKLKSKGESTSRKSFAAKPIVVIQYTAEQIRNMIGIMKNLQSGI